MAMTTVTAARREHAPGGDRAGCEAAQATRFELLVHDRRNLTGDRLNVARRRSPG